MADITIKNLKNIQRLDFDLPRSGVYVLSGSNGSGKTTLLSCIERLYNPFAFVKNFRTSGHDQFDNFNSGEVIYTNNGRSVTYSYSNTRWTPKPKGNKDVLQNFGFASVLFLPSTGDRFYVQDQELNTTNILAAPTYIKDNMNAIFQTNKFSDLRMKRITARGRAGTNRRNYAFILPLTIVNGLRTYYSEKNSV